MEALLPKYPRFAVTVMLHLIVLALRKDKGLYQLTVMSLIGEFIETWLKNFYDSLLQGDCKRQGM